MEDVTNPTSFIGELWDELLDRELFFRLQEAQVLIEWWRQHSNRVWPQSVMDRPPAPAALALETDLK